MNNQENEVSMYNVSLPTTTSRTSEEVLIADSRDGETPAQVVERKLVSMLQGGELRQSQLQSHRERGPSA